MRIGGSHRGVRAGAIAYPAKKRLTGVVEAGERTALDVVYSGIVNPKTQPLPSRVTGIVGPAEDPTAILLRAREKAPVLVGTIFVSGPTDMLPHGLISEVRAVRRLGSKEVAKVIAVPVTDAVPSLDFNGSIQFRPISKRSKVAVTSALAHSSSSPCKPPKLLKFKAYLDSFELREASIGVLPPQLRLTLAIRSTESLGVAVAAAGINCDWTLAELGPYQAAIPVGPVVIPVYATLPVKAGAHINGRLDAVTVNIASTTVASVAAGAKDNRVTLSQQGSNVWTSGALSLSGTAKLYASVGVEAGIGVARGANVHVSAGFGPSFEWSTGQPCAVYADLGSLSAGVTLLGKSFNTPPWTPIRPRLWSGCAPEGGDGGSSEAGGSASGEDGISPGDDGGASDGDGSEQPLATLLPAWNGYFYSAPLPGTGGNIQTGPMASSQDTPPGLRIINTGSIGDALLAGVPPSPGSFEFHAKWQGPSEPMHGPFRLTVEPPGVAIPPNALPRLGIVADYGAWIDYVRPSPDGDYLAAAIGQPEVVVVYNLDTQTMTPLTSGADRSGIGYGGWPANLGWSPDGRYLAFTSTEPLLGPTANGPWYNVYLYDTITGSLSRLTDGTHGDSFNPAWSPDGSLLTFNQEAKVAIYDRASGETELLPCGPTFSGCRAIASADNFSTEPWSADSQHLTYLETDGYYEPTAVMVWDRASDSTRNLSNATSARLNPNGTKVMLETELNGDLKLMNVVSGAVEKTYADTGLYLESSQMTAPSAWSPDGGYVTGWRCHGSPCGPALMSVATGALTDVPDGGGALSGWKGNAPMWCYYHTSPQNYLEGTDCATYDPVSESSSVTYIDSWVVLSMDENGYYGEFGGTTEDYAVVTWDPW